MDYGELEKRLRTAAERSSNYFAAETREAADAISALTRDLEEARECEGLADAALSSLRAEVLEHAAQIAEATVSTHNPRWDKAGSERHMWRNTHWQEAQEAIAAAIRQSLSSAERESGE